MFPIRGIFQISRRWCSVTSIRIGVSPLRAKVINSSDLIYLKSDKSVYARLSDEIRLIASGLSPTSSQIKDKDQFLQRLRNIVTGVIPDAVVSPFGSAMNGFWSPKSDIDVCVEVPSCRSRSLQTKALRKLASALHAVGTHYIEPRFGAKVPIIRWAPRRAEYLASDISINNSIAVVNSQLVGAYCKLDPRMYDLGMTIKYWAVCRGINDRSRGTLSSFSLLLMLIHFLQFQTSPPIFPSLQDLAIEHNQPLSYCDGFDVRFTTDPALIRAEMDRIAPLKNTESTGELLTKFFKYYGYREPGTVIAIRDLRSFITGNIPTGAYVVDNPFEVGKDVANVSQNQYARIRQEFRRAHSIMMSNPDGDIMAAVCDRRQPPPPTGTVPRRRPHPLDPSPLSLGIS